MFHSYFKSIYSIDDESTKDYDDALSIEVSDNEFESFSSYNEC